MREGEGDNAVSPRPIHLRLLPPFPHPPLAVRLSTGNNRGNRYSHKHVSLSPSQDAYWNFSIDELARFDVPAMVDYVLRATGQEKLAYVGWVGR